MFCSNCGAKRSGNFCYNCGVKFAPVPEENGARQLDLLEPPHREAAELEVADDVIEDCFLAEPEASNWETECRYNYLLRHAEVRDVIARYTAQAKKGLSAEEFLKLCDLAYKPLVGVSLSTIATIALPLNRKLGFRTERQRSELITRPIGTVIVTTVCSMARRSQTLKQVQQASNGCVFTAALPSDLWAMDGEIFITVEQQRGRCKVEASTKVYGQLYDWGKSNRCLDQLYQDLRSPLT